MNRKPECDDSERDFESLPSDVPMDETDVSLRAYVARLSDAHISKYDPNWSDSDVIEWDGNFRADGSLMLVCCERDVEIDEFRRVLEQYLKFRGLGGGRSNQPSRQPADVKNRREARTDTTDDASSP